MMRKRATARTNTHLTRARNYFPYPIEICMAMHCIVIHHPKREHAEKINHHNDFAMHHQLRRQFSVGEQFRTLEDTYAHNRRRFTGRSVQFTNTPILIK